MEKLIFSEFYGIFYLNTSEGVKTQCEWSRMQIQIETKHFKLTVVKKKKQKQTKQTNKNIKQQLSWKHPKAVCT